MISLYSLGAETTLTQDVVQDSIEIGDWVNYVITIDSEGPSNDLENVGDMVNSHDITLDMNQNLGSKRMSVGSVTRDPTDDVEQWDTQLEEVKLDYIPTIEAEDYKADKEFRYLYAHLQNEDFDGFEKDYRQLLLIADQYFIKDGLLYKNKCKKTVVL